MRRLSIVTLLIFLLTAASLPAETDSILRASAEELVEMFDQLSRVPVGGVSHTSYSAPPKWASRITRFARVGPGFGFFINSHNYLVIQGDSQSPAEGAEKASFSMWAIVAIVLIILFFIVALIVVGVIVLLISRKRSKAQPLAAGVVARGAVGSGAPKPTSHGGPATAESVIAPSSPAASAPSPGKRNAAASEALPDFNRATSEGETVDLSRTVAITPASDTGPIEYGSIKFVSGLLAGQTFDISREGSCIGRDSTLSQIVIADPRISKRHVWIGVREGRVTIADQGSRNGTFVNDPKSERVTETSLSDGDTVILGESDVARFEFQK